MSPIIIQYIPQTNDATAAFLLITFGIFLILIFFSGRRGNREVPQRVGSRKRRLRQIAKAYNLEKHHVMMLQKVIVDQNIADPARLFQSENVLNRVLKRLISELEGGDMPEGRRNRIVAEIFEIKRRIVQSQAPLASKEKGQSRNLKLGQVVTVYSKELPPAQSCVTANLDSYLAIEAPTTTVGSPVRYRPGSALKIRVHTGGKYVYTFSSKLREYKSLDGIENMLIEHSTKLQVSQLRKDVRKPANIRALFQKVEVISEGTGKTAVKRVVVNTAQKNFGVIENISRGGCALFSRIPLQAGKFIKLTFTLGESNKDISVLAKVWRVEKKSPKGFVNRIGFTRVPTQHLNYIQNYVFGLSNN